MQLVYDELLRLKFWRMPFFCEVSVIAVAPPNLQNGCIGSMLQAFMKHIQVSFVKAWNSLYGQ